MHVRRAEPAGQYNLIVRLYYPEQADNDRRKYHSSQGGKRLSMKSMRHLTHQVSQLTTPLIDDFGDGAIVRACNRRPLTQLRIETPQDSITHLNSTTHRSTHPAAMPLATADVEPTPRSLRPPTSTTSFLWRITAINIFSSIHRGPPALPHHQRHLGRYHPGHQPGREANRFLLQTKWLFRYLHPGLGKRG